MKRRDGTEQKKRRAWERGRESSKLDMSFFPITERARGPPPPSRQSATTTASPSSSSQNNADLLGIDFDGDGDGQATTAAAAAAGVAEASGTDGGAGAGGSSDRGPVNAAGPATKGVGEGVVFEGLTLPGVVHEETRAVDTENASVEASIKVRRTAACWFS